MRLLQCKRQRPIFEWMTIKSQQVLIQCKMNKNSIASKEKCTFFRFFPDVLYCVWYVRNLVHKFRPKHLYKSKYSYQYKFDSEFQACYMLRRASLKNAFFNAPYWL